MWRIQHSGQMAGARLVWFGLIEVILVTAHVSMLPASAKVPKCLPSRLPPPFALSTFHFPHLGGIYLIIVQSCQFQLVDHRLMSANLPHSTPNSKFLSETFTSPAHIALLFSLSTRTSTSTGTLPRRNLRGNVHVHSCYGIYM